MLNRFELIGIGIVLWLWVLGLFGWDCWNLGGVILTMLIYRFLGGFNFGSF